MKKNYKNFDNYDSEEEIGEYDVVVNPLSAVKGLEPQKHKQPVEIDMNQGQKYTSSKEKSKSL